MNLEDRLYTSTEVADILGVSLRSVYRYLEEGKISAEVKTATGRHRFTKKNILDFLYPQTPVEKPLPQRSEQVKTKVAAIQVDEEDEEDEDGELVDVKQTKQVKQTFVDDGATPEDESEDDNERGVRESEPVDWLAKFREAANKFKQEEESSLVAPVSKNEDVEETPDAEKITRFYYRSSIGGLRDIAQNVDKSARKSLVDYAFTMQAGLSLHKPIKPFSILHTYVRNDSKEFFEKALGLTMSDKSNAQLCLIISNKDSIYENKKEMHGLYVASDLQLRSDLVEEGLDTLVQDFDSALKG